MLKKEFRLRQKEEVEAVFKRGKFVSIPELIFRFLPNNLGFTRITILVGVKLSNKAVHRNRIRRRLRELARLNLEKFPKGFDLLIVARDSKLREMEFERLTQKFLSLVARLPN
ncbi:MAG: ribonuclease P protein component [Patescibacteria group bacterium]